MPDRVKEAIFSMLGSRYDTPGALPPLSVADVFAGSGSMGLEALSRGAAACVFFERDAGALDALRINMDALGAGPEATIVTGNAWNTAFATSDGRLFDLILLDPPYRDSEDVTGNGCVRRYLALLGECPAGRPLVVVHHHARNRFAELPDDPWRVVDRRTMGTNAVTLFER